MLVYLDVPLSFPSYMQCDLSAVKFYCTFSFGVNFICNLLFHLISNSVLSSAKVWRIKQNEIKKDVFSLSSVEDCIQHVCCYNHPTQGDYFDLY